MNFKRILTLLALMALGLSCEKIIAPRLIPIDPLESDPDPTFNVTYQREHTTSSGGLVENVQMILRHLRGGELIDYGRISFGGIELCENSDPVEGKHYYNFLQTGIADHAFQQRFRFDQGDLTFKAGDSPVIEDIETTLQVPRVSQMMDVTFNMVVDPAKDWTIRMNHKVNGAQYILQPREPAPGSQPLEVWMLPPNNPVAVIPTATLQALKAQSLGSIYLISYEHTDFSVDSIMVRGKGSKNAVFVPVHLKSIASIEFVM